MGEYTECTTSLDKQATLHFSYLKTLPWRHNQEIPLFLWGQCSASCAKINMASRQAIQIFSERTAWGGPALVLTVYCKWPSPTEPHVPCTWQHALSWKCLNNYWRSPCYIICTLKVHWHLWGSEWPEDWGLPSNGHGNHVDGDERGTGRAWGQRFQKQLWQKSHLLLLQFCSITTRNCLENLFKSFLCYNIHIWLYSKKRLQYKYTTGG